MSTKCFAYLLAHGAFWGMGILLLNLPGTDLTLGIFSGTTDTLLMPTIIGTAWNAILFYSITNLLIPRLLTARHPPWQLAGGTVLAFVLVSAAEIGTDSAFAVYYGIVLNRSTIQEVVGLVMLGHVLIVVLAFAYRLTANTLHERERQARIQQEQLRAELERLKAQIHPHFLFNTLNSLFALALQQNADATAEGIQRLSALLRFMLASAPDEQIEIHQEWAYIEHYAALQQLRMANTQNFSLDLRNELSDSSSLVAPLLFMPLVENAFKYGTHPRLPATIVIRLWQDKSSLHFSVENAIFRENQDGFGLGLANLRQRLDLLYPNQHRLDTHAQDDVFTAHLQVDL